MNCIIICDFHFITFLRSLTGVPPITRDMVAFLGVEFLFAFFPSMRSFLDRRLRSASKIKKIFLRFL